MYYRPKTDIKTSFVSDEKPQPKEKKRRTPLKKSKVKIKPRSKKREAENKVYLMLREKFLRDNPVCFIDGCEKVANTIEHTQGRGINFLNVSTWKPCCLEHNLELENNPELSKKYQLSKIHGKKKI